MTPSRHVDSAQWYENEAQVGDAVRESGLDREDVFVSKSSVLVINPSDLPEMNSISCVACL